MTTYGGPEVLSELDLPAEEVGPGQVRIAVTAAAVNPTDTMRREGGQSREDAPPGRGEVPGMDAAGTVAEVGAGVELEVGQRVMAIVKPDGEHGGYRSDLVVPAASVAPVPDGASDAEAASLPMNGMTAQLALDELGLSAGDVLAVTGAAGAFGGYVVQLAALRGITVVADAAEGADEELVRSLGASVVVRRGDDVADAILAEFPDGVDGLADGALLHEGVITAVKPGGTMVTVRGWEPEEIGEVTVVPIFVGTVVERQDWLEELRQLASDGELTLRVAETFPAAQAAEAHRRLEAGGVRGRLVLTF